MRELGRHAWAELADELAAMVIRGELKPGQRLVETEIAAQFEISRGPVRTALADLAQRGLAEEHGRRGLMVVEMTARDIRELYTVRMALEQAAIAELAKRTAGSLPTRLAALVDRLDEAARAGDHPTAVEADLAFHRELCAATGNGRLLRAWESLADQIRLVIGTLQDEEQAVVTPLYADHRLIFDALRAGTADVAKRLLDVHLVNTRDAMLSRIGRDEAPQ